jgi:two-component system, chemotaxis family, chemotaxis protein CheY
MDLYDINTSVLSEMTVLIVDDDKTIRDIIMQNLRGVGFQRFLHANNGVEANKHMLNSKTKIDLILCDWDMPEADGLTFLRAVRAHELNTATPFIMITAQQSQERLKISQAAKYKVDAYIVKPFQAEVLRKKVFQVLRDSEANKNKIA